MSSATLEFMRADEIVRAGAGAGKTYALTHRVMDLADEHLKTTGKLPRLIVTTFTRKATQELRERLMLLVLEERPHLVDFVNSRSNLVVSTIHGVMDLYLKRYGSNICIDPGYRIVGSSEASKIARQTLRKILLDESSSQNLLETFAFNALVKLVRKVDQVLIENPSATPFSLEDFASLFQSQALSAANELLETAHRIREEATKDAWIKMADGYEALSKLLRGDDWQSAREAYLELFADLPVAKKSSGKAPQPVSESTMEMAKASRSLAKEFLEPVYDPRTWEVFAESYKAVQKVAECFAKDFRKTKMEQGVLEISDLEGLAMQCIREHPETAAAFWTEWDHWLVDEYQDTSPFQVELIRHLTGERPSFIVGDPQQSIYLFRGARSEVFAERQKQIAQQGGAEKLLRTNRRSRPELLIFLNDFFGRLNPPFASMEPFFKDDQKLDLTRLVAKVVIVEKPEDDEDAEEDDSEALTEEATAEVADPEMTALVCHVQELMERGALPEDICILGRTNKSLHEAATYLNRYRLPTHVHVSAGFYDRREVRDALALLKFLTNPHDNFNTVELLRSPWFKIPDDTLMRIAASREKKSLWVKLNDAFSLADELEALQRLRGILRECGEKGLTQAFKQALIDAGFIDLSHLHDVSGRRESNLWKLLSRLQQEECKPGFNPLAFVSAAVSDLRVEEGNAEGDAVAAIEPNRINLMTVHASKGLEFKHVILPRMHQRPRVTTWEEFTYDERRGRWAMRVPFGEDREMTRSLPETAWLETFQMQELEEHARVLYVALTRASESVYLSWTQAPQRNSWAEMVRLDLAEGVHETPSYRYEVQVIDGPGIQPVEVEAESFVVAEPRGLWKTSPLDAVAEKPTSVSDILEQQPGIVVKTETRVDLTRLLASSSRGTAVHRLMELLKYPHSTELLQKLIARWFPGQEQSVADAVNFVRESASPNLSEIIANGEVEWGFAINDRGLLIEGKLDLWGRTDSGEAWIIDYKTGNPEMRQKAFDQMALYALALRKSGLLSVDEPLMLAAVYPFESKIFVEPEPDAERMNEVMGGVVSRS